MSEENKKTLAAYNQVAQKYLENTIAHDAMRPEHAREKQAQLGEKIRKAFVSLPAGSKVLEIGAADGENSKFLESLGYNVTASDVAPAFLKAIEAAGLKAAKFNVLTDEFPDTFAGVLCWRVFVHFTSEDIALALQRVYDALEPGGRFMFNVIDRETHDVDSQWVDFNDEYKLGAERFYAYYREDDMRKIVEATDFKVADFWKEKGGHNDWLVYVLEK